MSGSHNILQVSLDEDVFNKNASQDSRARQISYAKSLKRYNKNYHLINIILTENKKYKIEYLEDVTFIPCNCYRLRHILTLAFFLRKLHRKNKIILITAQDIHGIFWGALVFSYLDKVPVIGQIHYDLSSEYARVEWLIDPYGRLYESVTLKFLKYFDGIRVVNNATKHYLEKLGYKRPVSVCPVPVSLFPNGKNSEVGTWKYPGALRVLYVGRFVKFKNLDCWIKTAKIAVLEKLNIEFVLIGDGDERAQLESYCEDMGIDNRIQFVGALKPKQLSEWYSSADIFLLTSIYEGFGRVIVEAMNYNVVPVCSKVAGPEDIVKHGFDGFLDDPVPEKLVKHLFFLESNREKLKEMGLNAKNSAKEKYNPDELKNNWLEFLLSFTN